MQSGAHIQPEPGRVALLLGLKGDPLLAKTDTRRLSGSAPSRSEVGVPRTTPLVGARERRLDFADGHTFCNAVAVYRASTRLRRIGGIDLSPAGDSAQPVSSKCLSNGMRAGTEWQRYIRGGLLQASLACLSTRGLLRISFRRVR
ncbi:hypothetical protein CCHR01_08866 [Colletotrichum chrysophilum]|uniref:Uncharacterized protein n=1 Tax=Colletotrichum chrysophilum TaxID=1836956 RepID=A0AAD9EEN3_9PEZI|nr:hypothetical protein CCHR01_08866 [Colletotrichum chrysophilum]